MAKAAVKTRTRTVVVRQAARRRKKQITVPLTIAAPMIMIGSTAVDYAMTQTPTRGLRYLSAAMTGYDPGAEKKFDINRLKAGFLPLAIGMILHKVAGRLGVNRALSDAGIPIIRI